MPKVLIINLFHLESERWVGIHWIDKSGCITQTGGQLVCRPAIRLKNVKLWLQA